MALKNEVKEKERKKKIDKKQYGRSGKTIISTHLRGLVGEMQVTGLQMGTRSVRGPVTDRWNETRHGEETCLLLVEEAIGGIFVAVDLHARQMALLTATIGSFVRRLQLHD